MIPVHVLSIKQIPQGAVYIYQQLLVLLMMLICELSCQKTCRDRVDTGTNWHTP
jgi:hypothetical protein